jgi:hypothetical protein
MITKSILAYGKRLTLACDGRCDKAWGINGRERRMLTSDPDDYVFVADGDLGTAPACTGVWEGGDGKPSAVPLTDGSAMNRWCLRECERSDSFEEGEAVSAPDMSNPRPNKGWRVREAREEMG